jgi:hypothetical protein
VDIGTLAPSSTKNWVMANWKMDVEGYFYAIIREPDDWGPKSKVEIWNQEGIFLGSFADRQGPSIAYDLYDDLAILPGGLIALADGAKIAFWK